MRQPDFSNTLFPDWQPKAFPVWIDRLPRDARYVFQNRASMMPNAVDQMFDDNLDQLVPIVLCEGSVPAARAAIGKSGWKAMHKSSLSTNVMRARLRLLHQMEWKDIVTIRPCHLRFVNRHVSIRGKQTWTHRPAIRYAAQKAPSKDAAHILQLYSDAEVMGVAVNFKWSLTRLKKEHDLAALRLKLDKTDSIPFARPMLCHIDGLSFDRLISEQAVAAEGITQRHCVGSYAGQARRGTVYLFKVDGAERATLSIEIYKGHCALQQIYKMANRKVRPQTRAAAQKLVRFVNRYGVL
ncbi:MAG: PcfJ domain-containing protein [Pseudomonadota bacterium]